MSKLITYLLSSGSLIIFNRRPTLKFYFIAGIAAGIAIIILFIILSILLANYAGEFWHKVGEILGRELVTSRYWMKVASGE